MHPERPKNMENAGCGHNCDGWNAAASYMKERKKSQYFAAHWMSIRWKPSTFRYDMYRKGKSETI